MGNIAKLFPYRDTNNRMMFRGKIGCAGGNGVSKFFPVRVDGQLMLRGKKDDGKILWGFPYRDSNGRLMGRTLYAETITGCNGCTSLLDLTFYVAISGISSSCNPLGLPDGTVFNGTHTLTRGGGAPTESGGYCIYSTTKTITTVYNDSIYRWDCYVNATFAVADGTADIYQGTITIGVQGFTYSLGSWVPDGGPYACASWEAGSITGCSPADLSFSWSSGSCSGSASISV